MKLRTNVQATFKFNDGEATRSVGTEFSSYRILADENHEEIVLILNNERSGQENLVEFQVWFSMEDAFDIGNDLQQTKACLELRRKFSKSL